MYENLHHEDFFNQPMKQKSCLFLCRVINGRPQNLLNNLFELFA